MLNKCFSSEIITPDFLKKEIEKLILLNDNNFGLLYGQTGLCIIYFLLSDLFPDTDFSERANHLLNKISDNISIVEQLDFENGLAGIGWGIEWMVQNGYIQADTNEVLEDLDDELYKTVTCLKSPNISLKNGTIGKAMFFYKRLMSQNQPDIYNRYRNICNLECLVLLIDEMKENLLAEGDGILTGPNLEQSISSERLIEVAHTLIFLTKILPKRINLEIAERLIRSILSFIKNNAKSFLEPSLGEGYLHLLYAYSIASEMLQDVNGVKHAKMLYDISKPSLISNNDKNLFHHYLDNRFYYQINSSFNVMQFEQRQFNNNFDLLFLSNQYHKKLKSTWNEAWLLS
jgi:hypothetical protein